MRCLFALTLLLAASATAEPTRLDLQGYPALLARQFGEPPPSADQLTELELQVDLDDDEGFVVTARGALLREAASGKLVLPLIPMDKGLGDACELLEGPPGAEATLLPAPGFEHLVDPAWCAVELPGREASFALAVRRPRVTLLGDVGAWLLPLHPPLLTQRLRIGASYLRGGQPRVVPHRWGGDLRRETEGERLWVGAEFEAVAPMPPLTGMHSVSGRMPLLEVTTGEDWDELAVLHRKLYDEAAAAQTDLGAWIGRVLAQPSPLAAVREAARLALDEVERVPGHGGLLQVPEGATFVAQDRKGTDADRAALLVALLRAVEIRAEIVLASASAHPVESDDPLPLLNRTLVLVPKVSLTPDGGPLYVDPSSSSAALGLLPEELLGRDALLLGPRSARWLRLPEAPPTSRWNLSASELKDGSMQVSVTGQLTGGPARRVLAWTEGPAPADLGWLAQWAEHLPIERQPSAAGVEVSAQGVVPREVALPGGLVPRPPLPEPSVGGDATELRRLFARDLRPGAAQVTESWTFRGLASGARSPNTETISPFWSGRVVTTWSGPVFQRRSQLSITAGEVPVAASDAPERLARWMRESFDGVLAPPR